MNSRLRKTALLLGMQLAHTASATDDAILTAFDDVDPHASPGYDRDDPDIASGGLSKSDEDKPDSEQVLPAGDIGFDQPNYIFTTLASGSGDLTAWLMGPNTELVKPADLICQREARRGDLPGADDYVAWLSDDNDDAYCRAHGLEGKVDDLCGQQSLPDNAGPWVRLDGRSFGGRLPDLLAPNRPIRPVEFAPFNTVGFVRRATSTFTGTNVSGIGVPGFNCNNWQDDQADGIRGSAAVASASWAGQFAATCDSNSVTLICLRPGEFFGGTFPTELPITRRIFVTSDSGPGDLSQWPDANGMTGLAAGDEICRAHASRAGLANSDRYRAWLSDSSSVIVNAIDRFESDGILLTTDGYTVTRALQELVSVEQPSIGISLDENGRTAFNNAWTGTFSNGIATGATCNGWTESDASGRQGSISALASARWTSFRTGSCNEFARLYCMADFADEVQLSTGFERIETFNPE